MGHPAVGWVRRRAIVTRDKLFVELYGAAGGNIITVLSIYNRRDAGFCYKQSFFATDRRRSRPIDLYILLESSLRRITDGRICYLRKLFAQGCGTCILELIEEVEMTTQEAKEYRKALKKVTQKVTSSKSEARKFLRKAGIVTKSGHLTTHYK